MSESVVNLGPSSSIAENSVKRFEVGNKVLAVYNIDGAFYATDDECTHGAASLSDGILDGEVIECTMHFGAFDVRTGAAVQAPCSIALRTYRVEIRDDEIFVDFDKTAQG
jgi:nitrite reductase/ring-hydroxylating ferredoxin subunit